MAKSPGHGCEIRRGSAWSHELDHVPLTQRRTWLLKSKPLPTRVPSNSLPPAKEVEGRLGPQGDGADTLVVKKGDLQCNYVEAAHLASRADDGGVFEGDKYCSELEEKSACPVDGKSSVAQRQSLEVPRENVDDHFGALVLTTSVDTGAASVVAISSGTRCLVSESAELQSQEKVDSMCPPGQLWLGRHPSAVKNCTAGATGSEIGLNKKNDDIHDDGWSDELDHVPLVSRREMLLASRKIQISKTSLSRMATGSDRALMSHGDAAVKKEEQSESLGILGDGENRGEVQPFQAPSRAEPCNKMEVGDSDIHGKTEMHACDGSLSQSCSTVNQFSSIPVCCKNGMSCKSRDPVKLQLSGVTTISKKKSPNSNICNEVDNSSSLMKAQQSASLAVSVKVKTEPSDQSDMPDHQNGSLDFLSLKPLAVKSEANALDDLLSDKLDHMLLQERLQLLKAQADCVPDTADTYGCYAKPVFSVPESTPAIESVKLPVSKRLRKRKKTATDSVETALEEDAPGLLKMLLDKGVAVDEIKLYGEAESDELLEESPSSDGFSKLEDVILKLFFERQSLLKFASVRCLKDAKNSYCLACLISLVEQTRYLRFRKWPVEWGWCRDLQSFIFVFERHNRMVLERPEYGYATYFFELVDSLPIEWQIKRLVIAMKLSSCSRITLIENKALVVGKDLTEGEAQVLMEYGWIPNTGLGTMLNYCDRVVHDRRNEKETSEWRAKIGKLLIDGYNGGSIVPTNVKKVTELGGLTECVSLEGTQLKMEVEL